MPPINFQWNLGLFGMVGSVTEVERRWTKLIMARRCARSENLKFLSISLNRSLFAHISAFFCFLNYLLQQVRQIITIIISESDGCKLICDPHRQKEALGRGLMALKHTTNRQQQQQVCSEATICALCGDNWFSHSTHIWLCDSLDLISKDYSLETRMHARWTNR